MARMVGPDGVALGSRRTLLVLVAVLALLSVDSTSAAPRKQDHAQQCGRAEHPAGTGQTRGQARAKARRGSPASHPAAHSCQPASAARAKGHGTRKTPRLAAGSGTPRAATGTAPSSSAALSGVLQPLTGQITGTVSDASTHAAVSDVEVCALTSETAAVPCSFPASEGAYTLPVSGGEYRVEFFPPNETLAPQFYNGKSR